MKKGQILILAAVLSVGAMTSCKKKGCIDANANNYNAEAKKDDGSCTYPIINATGTAGDVSGAGGTATSTVSFTRNSATMVWDQAQNASAGSFNLLVTDADGTTVVNSTLIAGSGPQDADGTSSAGATGTWTATVTLTDYTGSGDYSFQ